MCGECLRVVICWILCPRLLLTHKVSSYSRCDASSWLFSQCFSSTAAIRLERTLVCKPCCTCHSLIDMRLQVAACDPRHTLFTMCRAARHPLADTAVVDFHVFEDTPECLARHILLVAILLDPSLEPLSRSQIFLEVFGNAMLRESTAKYLCNLLQELEGLFEKTRAALRYQEKDAITSAFAMMRKHASFDIAKAWDHRCRKWFGDRYDFRRNMV
jgi:Domain of unknown function (DUF4470)/Domain of unknown function (DUF4471)